MEKDGFWGGYSGGDSSYSPDLDSTPYEQASISVRTPLVLVSQEPPVPVQEERVLPQKIEERGAQKTLLEHVKQGGVNPDLDEIIEITMKLGAVFTLSAIIITSFVTLTLSLLLLTAVACVSGITGILLLTIFRSRIPESVILDAFDLALPHERAALLETTAILPVRWKAWKRLEKRLMQQVTPEPFKAIEVRRQLMLEDEVRRSEEEWRILQKRLELQKGGRTAETRDAEATYECA